jgi:hypothetical protein
MQRLLKEGKPILTAFHSVEENTVADVNGRHPFYVITRWRIRFPTNSCSSAARHCERILR